MIEYNFDVPFIANLALREKQIQQNYRPIIAVHKWFARRPGTLFRGLLLSEFSNEPLKKSFYDSNDLRGIRMADPFMGGGTPLLEANRTGCDVMGYDINPMSYWIVKQELEHLDLNAYNESAEALRTSLHQQIGHLYRTRCEYCSSENAHVKYFLWVKVQGCVRCGKKFDLFPGYLVAEDRRHPKNVFICGKCGKLTETHDRKKPGACYHCGENLTMSGPAKRNRCICPHCSELNRYPTPQSGPPIHRLFAIEYFCPTCKPKHTGRFFKSPDEQDLLKTQEAEYLLGKIHPHFIPGDHIPPGDETNRLHRWGYRYYSEMFNVRQKLGLELSARIIRAQKTKKIRHALATNISDLLRYQNMLCRYDSMALKSLDIFSVHGFPVGLIQCESNFLGIRDRKKGTNVGSGGWSNIIDKFSKAKKYCDFPFEIRHQDGKKIRVDIREEWIGDSGNGARRKPGKVDISCNDATRKIIAENSLDAVFTDPPYYGNVQYAELMDFCYVWLRQLIGNEIDAFRDLSTRNIEELTGNESMGRDLIHFTEGLSDVFQKMKYALKPGSPLVFTYHHNNLNAYYPVAVAILDAGLTCSASLPCPAEMGASIHINNSRSSITDTVFICRSKGVMRRKWVPDSPKGLVSIVLKDIYFLKVGNMKPTKGDILCIVFGHLIRLATWSLRVGWVKDISTEKKLERIAEWVRNFGGTPDIEKYLEDFLNNLNDEQQIIVKDGELEYETSGDEIPF